MRKIDFLIIIILFTISALLSSCDGAITHITESERQKMEGKPKKKVYGWTGWQTTSESMSPYGESVAGPKKVDGSLPEEVSGSEVCTPEGGIKITPSKPKGTPLSSRSIPYYYHPSEEGGTVLDMIPKLPPDTRDLQAPTDKDSKSCNK